MRLHRVLSGEDNAVGRRVDVLADDEPLGHRAELAQAEAGRKAPAQTRCVQAAGEEHPRNIKIFYTLIIRSEVDVSWCFVLDPPSVHGSKPKLTKHLPPSPSG